MTGDLRGDQPFTDDVHHVGVAVLRHKELGEHTHSDAPAAWTLVREETVGDLVVVRDRDPYHGHRSFSCLSVV